MEKVKAGLRGLSAEEKAIKGGVVHTLLSGNPHFPHPVPSLAELKVACDTLKAANVAALDRGRMACALKRSAVARMDSVLSRLAAYVNSACQGDVQKLVTSGFPLAKRPSPISDLQRPGHMRNVRSLYPGQVDLRWDRVPGALVYELEQVIDPDAEERQWRRVALTSKPRFVITDLVPNSRQVFRVRAIGTTVESGYSQELVTKSAA
jgi:hypothetical protein